MNVAQLKQFVGESVHPSMICSHVRMNVAQLKPLSRETLRARSSRFPRSNERGSIEARRCPTRTACAASSSHVRMNVAQLKQHHLSATAGAYLRSHVRMNVAQLKHDFQQLTYPVSDCSHVRMNVAQLKHYDCDEFRYAGGVLTFE